MFLTHHFLCMKGGDRTHWPLIVNYDGTRAHTRFAELHGLHTEVGLPLLPTPSYLTLAEMDLMRMIHKGEVQERRVWPSGQTQRSMPWLSYHSANCESFLQCWFESDLPRNPFSMGLPEQCGDPQNSDADGMCG
jgi:hypothetical protein